MDVELYGVGTALEGASERWESVLGEFPFRPPVGNALQGLCSVFGSYIVAAGGHFGPASGQTAACQAFDLNGSDPVTSTCWTE